MSLYRRIHAALEIDDALELEQILLRVPEQPGEELAYSLYQIVCQASSDIARQAIERLAAIRSGRGMPFLMQALTVPVRTAGNIIEQLDFAHLGTGWGRLESALTALKSSHRKRLVARLLEHAELVPMRRWHDVVSSLEGPSELALVIDAFDDLARTEALEPAGPTVMEREDDVRARARAKREDEETSDDEVVRRRRLGTTTHALAEALLDRLWTYDDPPEVQARIVHLLARVVDRIPFVGRQLMRIITHEGPCPRNRIVVREMAQHIDRLVHNHIDAAVPAFVSLMACGDDELVSFSCDCLHKLAPLGSPKDWYPLLELDDPHAQSLALRAFEQQPGDVGDALDTLLSDPDPALRRKAAETITHRLLRGRPFGVDALEGYMRSIAQDSDPDVGAHLDVASVLELSIDTSASFYAAAELLRSKHPSLVERVVDVLATPKIWNPLFGAGPPDLLVSALNDALVAAAVRVDTRTLTKLAELVGQLPAALVTPDLELLLATLAPVTLDRVVEAVDGIDDEGWQHARETYLEARSGGDGRRLRRIRHPHHAWVMTAGLASSEPVQRETALKRLRTLENPSLIGHVIDLLDRARRGCTTLEPATLKAACRALVKLPHPDGLAALTQLDGHVDESVRSRHHAALRSALNDRDTGEFVWPHGAELDDERVTLLTWTRHGAVHRPGRRLLDVLLRRPARGTRAVGRAVLSDQAWWQRDRWRDDAILWRNCTLSICREGPSDPSGWTVMVVTLHRSGRNEPSCCGFKTWVRSAPAIEQLDRASGSTRRFPFLHLDDRDRALALIIKRLADAGAERSVQAIAPLADTSDPVVSEWVMQAA